VLKRRADNFWELFEDKEGAGTVTLLTSENAAVDVANARWPAGNGLVWQAAYSSTQGRGEQVSRTLSSTLRHQAKNEGFQMDDAGYIFIDQLLQHPKFHFQPPISLFELHFLVDHNEKKRFAIAPRPHGDRGEMKLAIRATQGHTVTGLDERKLLREVSDPREIAHAAHGTFYIVWNDIKKQGLKTMGRNHIHFSPRPPAGPGGGEVVSGMRSDCQLMIEIDGAKAMRRVVH
jgi:2'-phosphotransferase